MSSGLREKLELFDPPLPLERASTIPACWYTDADVHAAERRLVFGVAWQAVGRLEQVAEPSAFFTAEAAGEPYLVVRDGDGVLRAFFNVCRHRAARVAAEAAGKVSRLRCRYHGWTYDLTGRLRGAPEFAGVADFDRDEQGLRPLSVAAWGPLVWVCAADAPPPLADFLAPLPRRHPDESLRHLRWAGQREYRPGCNWKVFIDNFLDGGYHVPTVHPGLSRVLDYPEYRTEVAGNTAVQVSPLRRPAPGPDGAIGRTRTGTSAHYWWVFPNFFASIYDDLLITSLVLPQGVDRCRVRCDFYCGGADGPDGPRHVDETIAVSDAIQQEDIAVCEEVQQGLASRSFVAGRYSVAREAAVHHFHRLLAGRLRQALA